jgi:NAD(P)-dependent dehydrogenase (short-subunit alcohol dehydrogenase family)
MSTIAIIGAGPGLGLAIAKTFGARGFKVALISRSVAKQGSAIAVLEEKGIEAAAFPADVMEPSSIVSALAEAAKRLDRIEVLEYSPVGSLGVTALTSPLLTDASHVDFEMRFQLYGAIAATRAVIPAMREAGSGTLLYTTGAGSIVPDLRVANVNAAAAALRNWVLNLHAELAPLGIQAAHVGIDAAISLTSLPGIPTAPPGQIAPLYWDLHTNMRDRAELVYRIGPGGQPQTFTPVPFIR